MLIDGNYNATDAPNRRPMEWLMRVTGSSGPKIGPPDSGRPAPTPGFRLSGPASAAPPSPASAPSATGALLGLQDIAAPGGGPAAARDSARPVAAGSARRAAPRPARRRGTAGGAARPAVRARPGGRARRRRPPARAPGRDRRALCRGDRQAGGRGHDRLTSSPGARCRSVPAGRDIAAAPAAICRHRTVARVHAGMPRIARDQCAPASLEP